MDLADVALFRAIASVGSLSAAARQMGTTPMLVSRRLAGLEAELGARLFHRTTRSLSLTPEGEAFLPHAVTLIEARDSALELGLVRWLRPLRRVEDYSAERHRPLRRRPCRGRVDRRQPRATRRFDSERRRHRHCDGRTGCGRSRGGDEAFGHDRDEGGRQSIYSMRIAGLHRTLRRTRHDRRPGGPPLHQASCDGHIGHSRVTAKCTEFGLVVPCRPAPSTRFEQPASRASASPC